MWRNEPSGAQTEAERPAADTRKPEPLPPPPSVHEEAILIAERLAALVETRANLQPARRRAQCGTRRSGVVGARHSGRLLGNLLVTRGFIVEGELNYALARQASTGDPIGQIVVDLGLITDRDLVELLAEQLRMQVVDLTRVDCDPDVLALISSHGPGAGPRCRCGASTDTSTSRSRSPPTTRPSPS